MHRRLGFCLLCSLLLVAACNGEDGDGGLFHGVPTYAADRAPDEGEFFLVGGAVHDGVMDLELHVLWPAGRGSLGVVFFHLKLPPADTLQDVRLADGWPAWTGTPRIVHATMSTPEGLWYFGVTPGVNEPDETGNRCDPCPEPREGDLHLATLSVRLGARRPARVDVLYDEDHVPLFCQDAQHGWLIMHPVVVGGVIQ